MRGQIIDRVHGLDEVGERGKLAARLIEECRGAPDEDTGVPKKIPSSKILARRLDIRLLHEAPQGMNRATLRAMWKRICGFEVSIATCGKGWGDADRRDGITGCREIRSITQAGTKFCTVMDHGICWQHDADSI